MFFNKISEIPKIAAHTSCSIFVVPPDTKLKLANPIYVHPDPTKASVVITVEQIRELISFTTNRETSDRFFVIAPADAMNEAAQNAFLKTFEEPREFCHFVLLTEQPSSLLPTILSRAQLFLPKITGILDQPPTTKDKTLASAKKLIAATARDLPDIANELAKNKIKPREQALAVTAAAIELLYKSYFKTGNPKFLTKLSNFLTLYDNLTANGHIKLHIVADLC